MMKWYIAFAVFVVAVGGYFLFAQKIHNGVAITNFEECAKAGNPIMESYPRQCRTVDGKTFSENVGNEVEKIDLVRLTSPRPNEVIASPLTVKGVARGNWFFEASFPLILTDWDGKIIAKSFAQAQSDPADGGVNWMTTEFVPFGGTLVFESPVFEGTDESHFSRRGSLILKKDNPSGLPENDDALEIPIMFTKTGASQTKSQAILETNLGNITLEFFPSLAPKTVENFLTLAKSGFYNGTKFHRVIKGFMIQGGDPLSKDDALKARWGMGGPGYQFADEIHSENRNVTGTIAMANSGPNTNGSQFFINTADNNFLDAKHTVFGTVIDGMDVVRQIENLPADSSDRPISSAVITRITVVDN